MKSQQLDNLIHQIDLPAKRERNGVKLRGQTERCRPCPRRGDDDRFHLRRDQGRWHWFCRRCRAEVNGILWHDAAEYARWLHGMSLVQFVHKFGWNQQCATRLRPRTAERETGHDLMETPLPLLWQKHAWSFVKRCECNLWASTLDARMLRGYLNGPKRDLSADAIRHYQLGNIQKHWKLAAQSSPVHNHHHAYSFGTSYQNTQEMHIYYGLNQYNEQGVSSHA